MARKSIYDREIIINDVKLTLNAINEVLQEDSHLEELPDEKLQHVSELVFKLWQNI